MDRSYPPSGFEIESCREGGDLTIRARGELDLAVCKSFEKELLIAFQSDASTVSLDLRELTFIDSTGIAALLIAVDYSETNGRRLRVAREISPAVQRAFEVTGIGERVPYA